MRKYTISDLEAFERDEFGRLICPTGDYTEIKEFPEKCSFDRGCIFGVWRIFGDYCSFGGCCIFGENCRFGKSCRFGSYCRFGEWCRFGSYCSFGEWCRFGERCSHEGLTNSIYVAIDRIGSELRKTYFFKAEEGYFVRAGCFFGTFDEFKAKVHETHGGTIHETTYLMACDLAVKLLDSQWK